MDKRKSLNGEEVSMCLLLLFKLMMKDILQKTKDMQKLTKMIYRQAKIKMISLTGSNPYGNHK